MAKLPNPVVIDFETFPIDDRPRYPPKPCGVSIMLPGERRPTYYAFAHDSDNNCTEREARAATAKAYELGKKGDGLLFHHGKFDVDVAETHWGLEIPRWQLFHDTLFLVFFDDPYNDLGLKPAAERILGMKPEERDAILEWAITNKLVSRTAKRVGHLIQKAPGGLVGKYADGDIIRTHKIFKVKYPDLMARGFGPAYDRERQLMPILLRNEREGVRGDVALLKADLKRYGNEKTGAMAMVDQWLRKSLKAPALNIDSDKDLADALVASRKADEALFLLTPGGNRSVSKDSLIGAVTDTKVLSALQYRARLGTALNTFLRPWHNEAINGDGFLHPDWNQVKQHSSGGDDAGARTGRLSASRFMNAPKRFKEGDKYVHPAHIAGLPELPIVRRYLLPDKGQVWCKRDYCQQELRVLAHFEDGALLQMYNDDPRLDIHQVASDMIKAQFHLPVERDATKTIGFGLLYGMGLGALAERLGMSVEDAKRVRAAYLSIFPGLETLQKDLTTMGKLGDPIVTWGGRRYLAEPPRFSEKFKRMMTFEYKLLNYLIQGSSADCTKEAIIRYDSARRDGRLLVTVHDEANISVPKSAVKSEMKILRDVMASVEFDVPMLSDGGVGPNWYDLKPFKEAA